MKIAILTCSVARSAGGLLDAIRDLYKSVLKSGKTQIDIYSYNEDKDTLTEIPNWKPLEIKLYDKKNPFYYSAEIKKDLLASDADILHVHGLWRYPHAFITSWKSKTKKPVVVTPHGMLDPYIIANQGKVKRILGKYLFADYCSNKIGVLDTAGAITWTSAFTGNGFTTFGEDTTGELYIAGGNSGRIYKITDSSLSTGQFDKTTVSVYPNPANEELFIDFKNTDGKAQASIYDLGGKLLLQQTLNNTSNRINTSALQTGIYLVEIASASGRIHQKLVID